MADRRHPPNRHLAWERLQRGWSYEELARRVGQEMDRAAEPYTGLCANTVRRWETGERWPEPRYRKHLVALFGKPASDLGLLTPQELSMRPEDDAQTELGRLCDVLTGEGDKAGVDRATVLRALLGVGVLPLVTPLLSFHAGQAPEGAVPACSDPDAYEQIAHGQRELYWTAPARLLHEAAYAHTYLGVDLVRGAASGQRATLARALAQSALLTARLAFFDLAQPAVAVRCYDVALTASKEAGDHALAAAVLGHMAFVPGFHHDPGGARNLIVAALHHSRHGVSPTVRSWLHCVLSEVEARAGAGAASRHQIDLAEAALADDHPVPPWFDFYDATRLDAFAGYAALAVADHPEAARRLTAAAERLGPKATKQRSVVFADLAAATCPDGDRAADYLS